MASRSTRPARPSARPRSARASDAVAAPRIDPLALRDLEDSPTDALDSYASLEGLRFEGADVSGLDLHGLALDECELVDVMAHETDLQDARLTEVRIGRLNAPALKAGRATLHGAEVTASRIGALELFDADLDSVVLTGCKLDWLNLRGGHLVNVVLRDCTLTELDLGEADATRVRFENCRAETVTFTGARLADVDLRGLETGTLAGIGGMRGAVVSVAQATAWAEDFASHLGIRVSG
ncbi:pentapeptide repeat-containing protein [Brachybacterium halotolerans subsp. kimchii]|uniref:pentapeptide repeat-containing protein n=1 Tax=Brachybacterium halotolerans TaxID=2795215 RepID=UPI001E636643|nr:pentapeptide repeat-containing protein [Brachybacterium halotolerans]UEJ84328.1 pentapeptide repeat-containing protein [Brachybacterium halotolerans subsp. kimchii]